MPYHDFRGVDIWIYPQETTKIENIYWNYKKELDKIDFPTGKYAEFFVERINDIVESLEEYTIREKHKTYIGEYDPRRRSIALYVDTIAFFTSQLKRYEVIDDKETFKDFLDTTYTNLMTYSYTDYFQVLYYPDMMAPYTTVHVIRQNLERLVYQIKREKNLPVISGKIGGDSPFNTTGFYV